MIQHYLIRVTKASLLSEGSVDTGFSTVAVRNCWKQESCEFDNTSCHLDLISDFRLHLTLFTAQCVWRMYGTNEQPLDLLYVMEHGTNLTISDHS